MSLQGRRLQAFPGQVVNPSRRCPTCHRLWSTIEGGAHVPGSAAMRRLGPCGHLVAVDESGELVDIER